MEPGYGLGEKRDLLAVERSGRSPVRAAGPFLVPLPQISLYKNPVCGKGLSSSRQSGGEFVPLVAIELGDAS
jgi:hypothetical protein